MILFRSALSVGAPLPTDADIRRTLARCLRSVLALPPFSVAPRRFLDQAESYLVDAGYSDSQPLTGSADLDDCSFFEAGWRLANSLAGSYCFDVGVPPLWLVFVETLGLQAAVACPSVPARSRAVVLADLVMAEQLGCTDDAAAL